jgi:hypothetical protein
MPSTGNEVSRSQNTFGVTMSIYEFDEFLTNGKDTLHTAKNKSSSGILNSSFALLFLFLLDVLSYYSQNPNHSKDE